MEPGWIALVVAVVVIVLVVVVAVALGSSAHPTTGSGPGSAPRPPLAPLTLPDDVRAEIDRLVASNEKIPAIKTLRVAVPGLSLRDAKHHVDAWQTHARAGISLHKPDPAPSGTGGMTPTVLADVDRLIAANKRIPAIKVVRDHTAWGLREAKEWVDARALGR